MHCAVSFRKKYKISLEKCTEQLVPLGVHKLGDLGSTFVGNI